MDRDHLFGSIANQGGAGEERIPLHLRIFPLDMKDNWQAPITNEESKTNGNHVEKRINERDEFAALAEPAADPSGWIVTSVGYGRSKSAPSALL